MKPYRNITLKKVSVAFFLLCSSVVSAQEVVPIYNGAVPNAKQSGKTESFAQGMFRNVTQPTLEIYLPEKDKATGTAVVIVPGGGYGVVVYQGEGIGNAKQFAKAGIAAFVLKYRLPDDSIMQNKSIGPLQDAQQAIKYVRENASKWGVDVNKVGIVGFSAGGHLASTAATHFAKPVIDNKANTNLRPDFQVVVYPVISMSDSLTHRDSRSSLLGKTPSKELIAEYSNELQVTPNTPPAYITHTTDDRTVDVGNAIAYYESLRRNKVPVEMHIYEKGGHGFIFRQPDWMDPLLLWMKKNKWLQ
ncbi:alpha/beta hydrolase [Paracnuella aquatica]|uniref:alpha/beta hydrolase n=1 Tax=Paracnuella aquatica TaxID=2268757 RepID=UPI000DF01CC4|nr:alpha/beta hydrolase [Paracnuella aquatica]RPD51850.1 alpha/beta hydrolase [Paracnuella aquatica]